MKRIIHIFLPVLFFMLLFAATATISTDFSQDLGRHLKLGEIIIKTKQIPSNNVFSYTFPNFSFINHHWLSEVIFYITYSLMHPNALLILKILLVLSAFMFVITIAVKQSNSIYAIFSAFIFFPLFLERNDIRPELFGYLCYAIFLYIFATTKKINKFHLIIPVVLLFWVNLHISFVFGVFVCVLLLIKLHLLSSQGKISLKQMLFCALCFLVLLINPNGIKGALYPLTIFGNYGYPIVENQNIFFLFERTFNQLVTYFIVVSPIGVITIFFLFSRKKILEGVLLMSMFVISILQIRHFPFFVLTVIPFSAWMIQSLILNIKKTGNKYHIERYATIFIALLFLAIGFSSFLFFDSSYYITFDSDKRFGFGFEESEKEATDFILKHNLQKNIFNNFDIGGYLAYRLYPKYRLFIDNRPEAYPSEFVQKIYIPLQEDERLQNEVFKKYHINTIVFSHSDQTPWAQQFLIRITQNKTWQIVFLNAKIIIFTQNANNIDLGNVEKQIQTLIETENKYLNLLRYSQILKTVNKEELASNSFQKAMKLGVNSCALKRITVMQMENSINFNQVKDYKRGSFWCFNPLR